MNIRLSEWKAVSKEGSNMYVINPTGWNNNKIWTC
jgi:hypothetical protein